MRLLTLLLAFIGITLAGPIFNTATATLPGTSIKLSETKPWHITNLVIFEAGANKTASSYITFDFKDKNKGLQLNTTCSRVIPSNSTDSLEDIHYQGCESDYVNFIYDGEQLQVEHLYYDDSIGDPPYNGAIAFGHSSLNMTKTKFANGVLKTQTSMHVPITSLSG